MNEFVTILSGPFGVIVLCVFIGVAGFRKWWVWGYQLKEAERREEEWKRAALQGSFVSKQLAEHVDRAIPESLERRVRYIEAQLKPNGRTNGSA